MATTIKFTGPADKIKFNFRKLPTPMVEWEGTAKDLHDLIMKAWVESEPEDAAATGKAG